MPGGLNALGDQLAQNVYDTGINIASGAVLGAFGGVAHTASLIKLPARTPNRATYQELEEEIAQQISQSAARPDSPIKTELNVAPGPGTLGTLVDRGGISADVQRHVLEGGRGTGKGTKNKMTGGHWAGSANVEIQWDTVKLLDNGVIRAAVNIFDPITGTFRQKGNTQGGYSTLFPPSWSADKVLDEVEAAAASIDLSLNRLQTAISPSGVTVEFRVREGAIVTFYPADPQL